MSQRSAGTSPNRTRLGGAAAIITLIIIFLIIQLGGGDLLTDLGVITPTPTTLPTVTPQPPTAVPPTTAPPTAPPATTAPPTTDALTAVPPPQSDIPPTLSVTISPQVIHFELGQGYGARKGFWEVLFTAPTGSRDPATYTGGVDEYIAGLIDGLTRTLDIAAYEFNSPALTRAVLDAHERGVQVRIVTDDGAGLNPARSTLPQLIDAGIPIVDDGRSALMHNKFMIMDGERVLTGSMNFTVNGSYRNNNNVLILRSRAAVENYQTEFDEMFVDRRFGPTSPVNTPRPQFVQDGIPIGIYFAPEDDVLNAIFEVVGIAEQSIRFMAFSFTVTEIADLILERAAEGVTVHGIFERTGSQTQFSELTHLFCAGMAVRQDGNPFALHHKLFIIDDAIVVTGSFNFSANATRSNDENLVIIRDPDLAAQYIAEFDRRWAEALTPTAIVCE